MTKEEKIAKIAIKYAIKSHKEQIDKLQEKLADIGSPNAKRCPISDPCEAGKVWNPILCGCVDDIG